MAEGADDQQYFFDVQKQEYDDQNDVQVEDDSSDGDGETISQEEYDIDRCHKIGFFPNQSEEFCMTRKDVKKIQRRFKLFYKNWREFQKKDLVVKKSVMHNDGATFKP